MIRVAILDDEQEQAELLKSMVEASSAGAQLACEAFSSVDAFLACVQESGNHLDVFFCDVCLDPEDPERPTGIDLVEGLFPEGCGTQVVYVSDRGDYHSDVYRTQHVGFLMKPVGQAKLDETLARCLGRIEKEAERPLRLHVGSSEEVISPSKILYIESNKRIARLVLIGHKRLGSANLLGEAEPITYAINVYAKLSDLARSLPSHFVQCHKSYLVNLDQVESLRSRDLVLSTGDVIPVSQSRKHEVRDALSAHVRGLG